MSSFRHSWRLSLPAALALAAVCLSSTTACLTTAIVSEARQDAANARQAAANAKAAERLRAALLTTLPASHRGTTLALPPNSGRGLEVIAIEATGDFSTPERIAAFVAAVRQLYVTRDAAIHLRFKLRLYDRASEPPRLVAEPAIAYTDDLVAASRRALPPASARTYESERLFVSTSGADNTIYVTARGLFTPEATRGFEQVLREAHGRLPIPTQLTAILVSQHEDGRFEKVAEIRLGAP